MGILNVTPDSFSDGGLYTTVDAAVARALEMEAAGADIIDVGGESTRPGSKPVSVQRELERTIPIIEALKRASHIPISIDTTKAAVARQAIAAGAQIINDVSAGSADDAMFSVAAESGAGLVLMHMKGRPQTMQNGEIVYDDVVDDLIAFFERRISAAIQSGVHEHSICIDPGIGFGKTVDHNLELIRRLNDFTKLGRPILVGASRKSFLGRLTGRAVEDRGPATAATTAIATWLGAHVVRVHDVEQARDVVRVAHALRQTTWSTE